MNAPSHRRRQAACAANWRGLLLCAQLSAADPPHLMVSSCQHVSIAIIEDEHAAMSMPSSRWEAAGHRTQPATAAAGNAGHGELPAPAACPSIEVPECSDVFASFEAAVRV